MKTCEVCEADFIVKANRVSARVCSNKCKGELQRTERLSSRNPAYKHGRSEGWNIRGWNLAAKGESICRSCGAPAVHLHHAIPRGKAKAARTDLRNGLPLCASCHTRWHAGHPIRREVFTKEEWDFLSSVELTGEEVEEWLNTHYPSAASIKERALVAA